MAFLRFSKRSYSNWEPASYVTDEIKTIINVAAGDVVGAAFMRITEAFNGGNSDATLELGDGSDTNRFITTTNSACTATGLKQGTGAGLTEMPGYMYAGTDTIDINCITDTANDATTGIVDSWIFVAKADPH